MIREMSKHHINGNTITYIRVNTPDYKPMSWDEIHAEFSGSYPGRWAVQIFPPTESAVNDDNLYHLYMMPEFWEPCGEIDLSSKFTTVAEKSDTHKW